MNRVVIHSYHRQVFDNPSDELLDILCPEDTYEYGVSVSKNTDGVIKNYQLLRGSKLSQSLREESKYGYEYNVARKLGKIAGERFLRNPSKKMTVIKTKVNLLNQHHATVKAITRHITGGLYQKLHNENFMIYNVGDSYLFINLNKTENLTMRDLKQTIQAIVDTYQPELKRVCSYNH
jgi:hypothetical protein